MFWTLTTFGQLVLPLLAAVLLFERQWLLPALIVAATIQAPSIINVSFGHAAVSYGVTLFNVLALLICLSLLWHVKRLVSQRDWLSGVAGFNMKLWLAYATIAILGAVSLPFVFADTPVYLLIEKKTFESGVSPLHWSLSNLAQIVNILLLVGILIHVRLQANDRWLMRRIATGFVVAVLISALIGLHQRLAWHNIIPMMSDFWASNPTYAQSFVSFAGPVARVSWPFTEPAYGSVWFAAILGGCLLVFFAGKRKQSGLMGGLVAGFALLNTLGATGFLALGLATLLGLILGGLFFLKRPEIRWELLYRLAFLVIVIACCGLALYIVLRHYGEVNTAQMALLKLLAGDNRTFWGDIRPQSNLHALSVLQDSYGFGVGMGSNRASSYFASLFSNSGLLGGLAFLMALLHLTFTMIKSLPSRGTTDFPLFLSGALITATIAVGIAIPDQNWPAYWAIIIAAFAWINQAGSKSKRLVFREKIVDQSAVGRKSIKTGGP